MTILDVACWLGLSWAMVKTVIKERLEKDYRRIGYRRLKRIGIDELYLGPRKKYVTLVIDYDSGRVIWVKEGRGGASEKVSKTRVMYRVIQPPFTLKFREMSRKELTDYFQWLLRMIPDLCLLPRFGGLKR